MPNAPPFRPLTAGVRGRKQSGSARLCWGIFLFSLAVYLVTANGHLAGQDQEYYYRIARALALHHTFAVEPIVSSDGQELAGARAKDGRFYTEIAPGWPLVLAPFVLVGRGLSGPAALLRPHYAWVADDLPDMAARFLVSYVNAPITAATAALLALLVLGLGYPARASAFVSLAFAFATLAWGQARVLFAEPLQGLLLLSAALLLLRCRPSGALLGGAALALALLVKPTSVVALPALLLLPDSRGRPLWRTPSLAVAVLAPVASAIVIYAVYNLLRFGNALETGYAASGPHGLYLVDPIVSLYGLMLSSGKGIVWFAPPVLAALLFYRHFIARCRGVGLAFAALTCLWLLTYSVVGTSDVPWDGGWGWGPRYLMPALPFVLVALAECWLLPRARLAAVALVVLGMVITLPGAAVDFMAAGEQAGARFSEHCSTCDGLAYSLWRDFVPAGSDFVTSRDLLLSGKLDFAWITFWGTWVIPLTVLLVEVLGTAGLLALTEALRKTATIELNRLP